ncbi:MAG: putative bifunctional diguanylate cyclase/phosphodiesterase, partial [Gammaproteobacteria bacterium]
MTIIRVLHLEDNESDAELVQARLVESGIACDFTRVETQEEFTAALDAEGYDVILSDNALPAFDGLSALAYARERCREVPFIFVSGTLGEEAAIEFLKAGATDYVLKQRLSRLAPAVQRALKEAEARAARERYEARLHRLAFYDGLTGLANRALLEDRLPVELAGAQRAGQSVALLFLDLDRFKTMNDILGHPVGDLLLHEIAARIAQSLRAADTAARWGGDEFIIVVPDLPGERQAAAESAAAVIRKVQEALARSVTVEGQEVEVAANIGVALYPSDGTNAADLIKHAGAAVHQAKTRGRNTFQFFTEAMHKAARERLFLENELRRALSRAQLTVHYQPQVRARDKRIIGAEALIRWRHPERGWISPAEFIPVAEETGHIQAIGVWVLEQVLVQIQSWRAMGLTVPRISVNVSPHQIKDEQFSHNLQSILTTRGLLPACLGLEFTESAMMQERSLATVIQLSQLGVELAVDDFGTGYSSLSYLKRFPLNALKIDQSFVRDLETDQSDAALVRAIIAMARSLRLRVVAEGVETEAQRT